MKRRWIAILMALCLLTALLPTAALAAWTENCAGGEACDHAAAIGGKHYDTLAEAVAAAVAGDTVTLLKDTITGVFIDVGQTADEAGRCASGVTFDLNGKTLTFSPPGGSTNTKTNGFRVLAGNSATVKNGNIQINGSADNRLKTGFAVYGTLELDGLTITHTYNDSTYTGSICTLNNGGYLTVKNCDVTTEHAYGKAIVLSNGDYYFGGASVNHYDGTCSVDADSVLNGTVVVERVTADSTASMTLSGTVNGKIEIENEDYTWNSVSLCKQGTLNTQNLTIGVKDAESLQAAVAVADDGDTVKLLEAVALTDTITISDGRKFTLDLNGKVLSTSAATGIKITDGTLKMTDGLGTGAYNAQGEAFQVAGEKLKQPAVSTKKPKVIVDAGVTVTSESDCCIFIFGANAAAEVYGSLTSKGVYATIQGNGNAESAGTDIRIFDGAVVKATNSMAMYIPQAGKLIISGGGIEGPSGLEVKAGTVEISGGSFKATAATTTHVPNGTGSSSSGYAFSLVDNKGYVPGGAVTISGGTFEGPVARLDDDQDETNNSATFSIRGGTYSSDPSGYVAAGYAVRDNGDGTFTVYMPSVPGPGPTEPEIVEVPVKGDEATVTVPVQVDKNSGAANLVVSEEKLEEIVQSGAATGTVTIDVAALGEDVTKVNVPTGAISAINESVQSEDGKAESLAVALPAATVEFDAAALDEMAKAAENTTVEAVTVSAETVDPADLPQAQQALLGEEALVLDLTVTVGDKVVSDFGGGNVKVSLPYTPPAGVDPTHVVVWFLSDTGKLVPCDCSYANGKLVFTTTHFSKYVVGDFPFTDVAAGAWYYESVVYAYAQGLMNGMTESAFVPGGVCDRAMVTTMLWRLAGMPAGAEESAFQDVPSGAYYAKAVAWAAEKGLVEGLGNGTFAPESPITREQLATLLWRYAKWSGMDVSQKADLLAFEDGGSVSAYAAPALEWACGAGLVEGKDGGRLDPQGTAVRAELAALFQRFLSL